MQPEQKEKLEHYFALLKKWQKAINLVSKSTLGHAWQRHFEDSIQLAPYLPSSSFRRKPESQMDKEIPDHPPSLFELRRTGVRDDSVCRLLDLGSGAGFPGLVLAIMRPDIEVHLVESDTRKCEFMRTVSRETNVGVAIHNNRIEDLQIDFKPDVVTARALASLDKLCGYALALSGTDTECLFLKGAQTDAEIGAASKQYDFECRTYASCTSKDAAIVHIKDLKESTNK